MPKFTYKAKVNPQDTVCDVITAENKAAAISRISNKGYYLLSIDECDNSKTGSVNRQFLSGRRVSLKSIADFTRQLSDLIEGGLNIAKALTVLSEQTRGHRLKEVVLDIREFCVEGNLLSQALKRHPDIFSDLFISMAASGEAGAGLGETLSYLADYCDNQLEIQSKIRASLAYPALMLTVGAITIVVLLTFVIPRIAGIFGDHGQSLPLPTQILITISGLIKKYWWLGLGVITAAVLIFKRLNRNEIMKLKVDSLKLRIPLLGNLIKKIEISRFSRTLGALLGNGVAVLQALKVVIAALGNSMIKRELSLAAEDVRHGSTLSGALTKSRFIPPLVVNMIAVGEESGLLNKSLSKIAKSYQREIDSAVKSMMSCFEPALILVLGSIIGFIVISMLLPIFEINFLVH